MLQRRRIEEHRNFDDNGATAPGISHNGDNKTADNDSGRHTVYTSNRNHDRDTTNSDICLTWKRLHKTRLVEKKQQQPQLPAHATRKCLQSNARSKGNASALTSNRCTQQNRLTKLNGNNSEAGPKQALR